MYGLVEKYFSCDICVLANPIRIMFNIVMKKAKIKFQLEKDNNGTG